MDNKVNKIDLFMSFSLNEFELDALKGGTANILNSETEDSKEGDGAKYVCCIKIELPKRPDEP